MEKDQEIKNKKNSGSNNMNNQNEIQQEQLQKLSNKNFENKNNDSFIKNNSLRKSEKSLLKQQVNNIFGNKASKKYNKNNSQGFFKYNKEKTTENISENKEDVKNNAENYLRPETKEKLEQLNLKKLHDLDKDIPPNFYEEKQIHINDLNNLKNDLPNNIKNGNILKKYMFDDNSDIKSETYRINNSSIKNNKGKSEFDYPKIYENHKIFAKKHKIFLILFIAGIVLNLLSYSLSWYLQFYGNKNAFICFEVVAILIAIFYSLEIVAFKRDKQYILSIIKNKDDPEKIIQSNHRKNILLLLYVLLLSFYYQFIILIENTAFINNIKMNIRARGYGMVLWMNYFQKKDYSEIIASFQKINITFLVFSWLSVNLNTFIVIFILFYLKSYRIFKSLIQIICLILTQSSLFQISFGIVCQNLIKITSLDEVTFSWVPPGEIIIGVIGLCLSIYGIYIFFTENKKLILIFNFICVGLLILSAAFSAGMRGLGSKFTSYKMTSCNNLFKFISEESIINKNSDCSNKYLFTTETLESIQCPKERIMINWELTENINNTINIDNDHYLKIGCIDQSCCLQTYLDIKLKYDYLEIISYYQISLIIILLIFGIYIYKNIGSKKALEEEIFDIRGHWIFTCICILLLITVFTIIFTGNTYYRQSELNSIKSEAISDYLTVIDGNLVKPAEKSKLIATTNEIFEKKKKEIINNYDYDAYLDFDDSNSNFDLLYFDYYLYSDYINILVKEDLSKNNNYLNYTNNTYKNKTQIINFKSKMNIINKLLNYFDYKLINPIKPINYLMVSISAIFNKKTYLKEFNIKNNLKKFRILNDNTNKVIKIKKENISSNYNEDTGLSKVNLLTDIKLNFSLINENYPFYIIGNILNDEGESLINIYNSYFGQENMIYSVKSNNNGSFILGPLYPLLSSEIFELNIEIYKITKNLDDNSNYERDYSYNSYNEIIKIGGIDYFGYYFSFHRIKDVLLPIKTNNKIYVINGNIYETKNNENYIPLSNVNVKIYKSDYKFLVNEILEAIKNGNNDNYFLSKTTSNKDGNFTLNVNSNGYYFLIYEKNNYFIETQNIIINETSENYININKMELIKLFNTGKIIVKLEWESKPNDLDLICRFKVSEKDYCYTFFGNKKCVDTFYHRDAKNGEGKYSEVIEIEEFSDYMYLFYVRKYFDESNGEAKNERKIKGVDMGENLNFTDLYKNNNELLINSNAKLMIYYNGLRYSMIKIDINDYINENLTLENSYKKEDNKDIYWIGFCIDGKEGLNTIKIINKISKNEPEKNICSSYYDQMK